MGHLAGGPRRVCLFVCFIFFSNVVFCFFMFFLNYFFCFFVLFLFFCGRGGLIFFSEALSGDA